MRITRKYSTPDAQQLSFDIYTEFWDDSGSQPWKIKLFSLKNIQEQMPELLPGQDVDVLKAEERFFKQEGKGMLFTNGTGTGKTFVGLGVSRRFLAMDKKHIIIICPTDKKCKDWIEEGEVMGIIIYQLEDINDAHHGVCVTTYANFYQNEEISKIHWHLVIYDECHYLQQNEKGALTSYQEMHRRISRLPSVKIQEIRENYLWAKEQSQDYLNQLVYDYAQSTKVLFLSATPFAYVKSLGYADGCLWDINERLTYRDPMEGVYGGYNDPDNWQKFMSENFGYRMRYNKLTIPETGVDSNLCERMFHEKYKEAGVISGRQINIDFDYSRDFILLHSDIGEKIDEGMVIFYSDDFKRKYETLSKVIDRRYKGMYVKQLLEAIKSRLIIPRIKDHLEQNRKVILFHDFNRAQPAHPFKFNVNDFLSPGTEEHWRYSYDLEEEIIRFREEYKDLVNMDLSELHNPIDSVLDYFEPDDVCIFNGTISKKKRHDKHAEFMDDRSDCNLAVVQRKAGKEGTSWHDKTGCKERVYIDLGLPTEPTAAIQGEGRIYRVGLQSNARYEYATIQTNFERATFADVISVRSRTAENLAMGNMARNMETIFKEGYINASDISAFETTGTGGKHSDRSFNEISLYDQAKTFYWANQKKTSKNKSKEGKDYYATPEPLGYKIVEWLNIKSDERILEPSAGHGAIGRFFPGYSVNTFVEPSYDLISKLKINTVGTVEHKKFEEFSFVNKFDKIAMNPPFGVGGYEAELHLKKALYRHMKKNVESRLIAIVPDGASMNKRLKALYDEDDFIDNYTLHTEIKLPACTFERAGTKVMCKILVIDKYFQAYKHFSGSTTRKIDLTYINTIEEFFDVIENLSI